MLPIAFLTYCPWPFEHTAHDLWRIRQQETFVVDQSFGVGGTGARCGGAPQVPFTQVLKGFLKKNLLFGAPAGIPDPGSLRKCIF